MTHSSIKKNVFLFLLLSLPVYFAYTLFLVYSDYFEIGLMSDDYTNFISAQSSGLKQKLTSSIPFYSNLHLRPVWFLSINFSIWINNILTSSKDNFIFFRIENLVYFYLLIFISSGLFFKITRNMYLSFAFLFIILLYPNNINDICWTVGKVDLLCAIFLFLSLICVFSFAEKKSTLKLLLTGVFFSLALLTKETSVIFPFLSMILIYVAYNKEKVFEVKNLLALELLILLIYFSYRIYILGVQPAEVVTKFQKPGVLSTAAVIFKAFISLILPYDYLSIQEYLNNYNFLFTAYSVLITIFIIAVIFIFIRTNNFKYIFILSMIFFVSIIPNIIAGYFRPQLIMIPFIFFIFALLLIAGKMKVNLKFYTIILTLILFAWTKLSFNLVQDWKSAYQKSVTTIKSLIDLNIDVNKRNIIIGLPSRYRQASMLDYAAGPYNYWKYGEFKMKDKIEDLVLMGALDDNSINSELSVNEYAGGDYEIITLGETQYFVRLDAGSYKYKDNDISFRLSEKNSFNKPTILRLRIKTDAADVYSLSNEKFIKLNK